MTGGVSEEGVLRKLIQQMNRHAPARRVPLSELAEMKDPGYSDREGRFYSIGKDELVLVRIALNGRGLVDVRLPIVLLADASLSQSAWRVEGRAECAAVSAVLDRQVPEPGDRMLLYSVHMAVLRRKLPTVTVQVFLP